MMNNLESNRIGVQNTEKVTFRQYFKIFSGVKMPWVFLAGTLILQTALYFFTVKAAVITGNVVDSKGNIANSDLIKYAVFMIFVTLASTGGFLLNGISSEKINLGLREKLWRKMIYLPQKSYDQDRGETLVSRVTTDCDSASILFTTIISAITLVFGLVLYLKQMFSTNVEMACYMLLLLPLSALTGWLYGKARYWVGQKTQLTLSNSTSYLIERIRNLRLIKASNKEYLETLVGDEMFTAQYKIQVKTGFVDVFYSVIDKALGIAGMVVAFVFGGILVNKGVLTVGQVVVFYTISGSVSANFSSFINSFGTVDAAVGSLTRVIKIFDIPSEDIVSGVDMDIKDADIRIEDVMFRYGDKNILNNFNCVIPKNKITAVIGTNGSGKSTLFKLLDRLYVPDGGRMLFGKTPAQEFNLHSWRKTFGVVPQDRPLIEGTIRDNITYGCVREISDDELLKVAKMANVYGFVKKLPDGFDTYVAPGGQNFSGGQRQCIAIARAIMYNPDYLLLDEATSNLDAKSERIVTDAIKNLMKDRTTIIIAHSLSAIRYADNVMVIKDGCVAASGSPQDIIKTSTDYQDFVMKQMRPERLA